MSPDSSSEIQEIIDIEEIKTILPHRYPFLMVDRVIHIEPGERATGIKNVTANEPHFTGHFPDKAIMPGVMIVEAMAQTAAIMVVKSEALGTDGKLVYFMSIESARFRRPIVPGDQVVINVERIHARGTVWKFSGEAIVDGKVSAEAKFTAMIVDP